MKCIPIILISVLMACSPEGKDKLSSSNESEQKSAVVRPQPGMFLDLSSDGSHGVSLSLPADRVLAFQGFYELSDATKVFGNAKYRVEAVVKLSQVDYRPETIFVSHDSWAPTSTTTKVRQYRDYSRSSDPSDLSNGTTIMASRPSVPLQETVWVDNGPEQLTSNFASRIDDAYFAFAQKVNDDRLLNGSMDRMILQVLAPDGALSRVLLHYHRSTDSTCMSSPDYCWECVGAACDAFCPMAWVAC